MLGGVGRVTDNGGPYRIRPEDLNRPIARSDSIPCVLEDTVVLDELAIVSSCLQLTAQICFRCRRAATLGTEVMESTACRAAA